MDLNEEKIKYSIFDLIKTSLNTFEGKNKYLSQIDANNIINFSKKFEYVYKLIYIQKSHSFHRFKRNIIFLEKYLLKTKGIKLKKIIKGEKEKALSYFIIPTLKIFIDNENHKYIHKILMILLKLSIEQIIPDNIYLISIELILNILIKIITFNSVDFCHINNKIYRFAEDIISSLISFSDEIKTQISKSTILTDVINLLDEYLFSQKYPNIILSGTPIWLRLLEIDFSISGNQRKNSGNSKEDSINKKINTILSKIYKFSLSSNYLEKMIFKNSILNIQYYNNYMNFLKGLFWEETKIIPVSDFMINEGIFLPKNNYLLFSNITSKNNEISIIFSFRIFKIENNNIDIMELFDNNNKKIILKLFINENGYLSLDNGNIKKLVTQIKIKENNSCYLLCISINKTNSKINLFVNTILELNNKNENLSSNDNNYSLKISNKINISNSSKDFSITVGKNNFVGIIGEFFFINKEIKSENIQNIFNMKGKYANIIREIYYNLKIPSQNDKKDKPKKKKNKSDELLESKEFLKQMGYEIIFEINLNHILYSKSNKFLKKIDNVDNINIINKNLNSTIISNNNTNDNSNFLNKKNFYIIKNLSKMNYSYDIFYQNYGLDYITFQLYNIFSKIDDNKLLNYYLKETLSFVRELICFNLIFSMNQNQKDKHLNSQMQTYFLTLLILLYNKKEKIYLENEIILIFIEIYSHIKSSELINLNHIIFSIILDVEFYKNKKDIFRNPKIFNDFKKELEEKSNDIKSIINKEFLYKIFNFDFCYLSKEYNHKMIMEIFIKFISFDENNIKDVKVVSDLYDMIHKEFILYFLNLKNEIKIYHYLKIIYLNFDKVKKIFENNDDFKVNIIENMEKIDYMHCKYCNYNQILLYLLNQEIINDKNENDYNFTFSSNGFMNNPSFLFLNCFFSQIFYLSNRERLKFIKIKSDPIDYIFSLMNEKKEVFNLQKFIPKLERIITYINILFSLNNEPNILDKILYFFKLIMNFLKRIIQSEMDIINKKNEINNDDIENNLKNLFCCASMKTFFNIYLNINYNKAIEELKYIINISINYVTFPFYFRILSENENNKSYNEIKLFDIIVDVLVKHKITFDLNTEKNIIKNNILLLIFIYNIILNKHDEINQEFENIILLFCYNLRDNYFFNCKYIFDTNEPQDKHLKKKDCEKKFLLEMVCEIFFRLYEIKNYDAISVCSLEGLFLDKKKWEILNIDEQNFKDTKTKDNKYIFFNNKFLNNFAKGEEVQEVNFSVYFILYFLDKYCDNENINNNTIVNKKSKIETENLSVKIIKTLLVYINKLLENNKKKIKNSIKELEKKNKYKSYIDLFEYIINKINSNKFSLDSLIEYYKKSKYKNEQKYVRKDKRIKTTVLTGNIYEKMNRKLKLGNISNNINNNIEKKPSTKIILQLTIPEERSSSFSKNSAKKISYFDKYGFNEIDNIIDFNGTKETKDNKRKSIMMGQFNFLNKQKTEQIKQIEKIIIDNTEKENNEDIYLKQKLKEINIPSIYFKKFFKLKKIMKIKKLFNPKEYYIWNKFSIMLKDVIFKQKKFEFIKILFNIKFKNYKVKKSSELKNRDFSLKYPSKLKNFICDDYYRPFTKPDLNFFNNKLLKVSHKYLNSKFLSDNNFDIEKINKIEFPRIIPINFDDFQSAVKIECECVNNYGSVFGELYINHAYLLFVGDSEKDPRKAGKSNNYENIDAELNYLYSFFLDERRKDKKKYTIMYYCEIKEIVVRRFCFQKTGYEIFMKNNKSHLFNFFNKNNLYKFIKKMFDKLENVKEKDNKDYIKNQLLNTFIMNLINLPFNINEEINFNVINKLEEHFEKNDYRNKHFKNELSNFKYLLLLNKYSSRSYNDLFQYLIFPLLYLDKERTVERDLSKAISLNKNGPDYEETISSIKNNYENVGYHFNYHYSTSGYVLYYLVRMNPFTEEHLKLQSNQFDVPKRMFYDIDNYLQAITFSEENRELIPEFFCNYEIFLNINYLNLGYIIDENLMINDLITADKNGISETIINYRQLLEKRDIIPWVDNIFGCNQLVENDKIYNIFPLTSYEKNNDYEKMKIKCKEKGISDSETINIIKDKLNLIGLGICPVQLLKNQLKKRKSNYLSSKEYSFSKINNNKSSGTNLNKDIQNFLKSSFTQKSKIFLMGDKYGKKLAIRTKKILQTFLLFNKDSKSKISSKKELWQKKHLKIEPQSKMFCELLPDILLSCRYIDKTIQINYNQKNIFQIQFDNIITCVEYYSHNQKDNSNKIILHKNEVIFGDENGYLALIQIEYEINNKKQINLINIKPTQKIKAHNSLIKNISFIERLNIIISFSEEGQITINNARDFNIINIIELGDNVCIKDIKISEYDLIYIFCTDKENEKFNYIKCYSLNGIKFTELKTEDKIINFFTYETLLVVYENNFFESFNLYDLDGKSLYKIDLNKTIRKDSKNKKKYKPNDEVKEKQNKKIIFCSLIEPEKKLIVIYDSLQYIIEDIAYMLMKD